MWMTLLLIVGVLALIAFGIKKYYTVEPKIWEEQGVPIVDKGKIASLFSRLTFKTSFIDFDRGVYEQLKGKKFGGYMEFKDPMLYVLDLDLLRNILVKDFDHFVDRKTIDIGNSDPYMSRMLTQMTGKEWKDLRSTLTPTFTTSRLKNMFEFFNATGSHLVDYLKEQQTENGDGNSVVDWQDVFGRYTMDAIASISFGLDVSSFKDKEPSKFTKMAKRFQSISFPRLIKIMVLFLCPPLGRLFGIRVSDSEAMDFFSSIIEKSMKYRRNEANKENKRNDFLQMLLEAQSGQLKVEETDVVDNYEKDSMLPTGGKTTVGKKDSSVVLDDVTIISQAVLFFIAGFDTIESLLTFTAYQLALNPEIQEKLAEDVSAAMENNDGELTYEVTHGITYLDQVISEVLRIHPPAFGTERLCTREYTIPGTEIKIPKGGRVFIPINNIHHDEEFYPDPHKFNPENFNAENKAKRHPYAFLPFGLGPRNCPAMRFAMTEAKAAIAHLVYNFKLEPSEKTDIPMVFSKKTSILKPANGMHLKFTSRN